MERGNIHSNLKSHWALAHPRVLQTACSADADHALLPWLCCFGPLLQPCTRRAEFATAFCHSQQAAKLPCRCREPALPPQSLPFSEAHQAGVAAESVPGRRALRPRHSPVAGAQAEGASRRFNGRRSCSTWCGRSGSQRQNPAPPASPGGPPALCLLVTGPTSAAYRGRYALKCVIPYPLPQLLHPSLGGLSFMFLIDAFGCPLSL